MSGAVVESTKLGGLCNCQEHTYIAYSHCVGDHAVTELASQTGTDLERC